MTDNKQKKRLDGLISISNQLHESLDHLLILNREWRSFTQKENYRPEAYAEEFCTVNFGAGRRTGKTRYILQHATPADLIVVTTKEEREVEYNNRNDLNIITKDEFISFDFKSFDFKFIYIEHPKFNVDSRDLYAKLTDSRHIPTFVFLGS